jgi:hypothetical protein
VLCLSVEATVDTEPGASEHLDPELKDILLTQAAMRFSHDELTLNHAAEEYDDAQLDK